MGQDLLISAYLSRHRSAARCVCLSCASRIIGATCVFCMKREAIVLLVSYVIDLQQTYSASTASPASAAAGSAASTASASGSASAGADVERTRHAIVEPGTGSKPQLA